ncbi:alpha-hydroxy-acid oxidizing protein [Actinomadura rayongensis]|uniref:Alpha-hydroxy-acid oxidizing protein n=2 Tax=Actinomadura rayongensis TaxID=1429076 RepID=A0A6I4W186_9ACTN|nr:alpha-hydroxy-acid oxidizing protein [Actinomadura rayongensis]
MEPLAAMYPQDVEFAVISEIRDAALQALAPDVADFLEGGAGEEVTLRANRTAFGRWGVRPRPMSGVSAPSTATTLLGLPLELPVLTAPFGGDALFHEQGHLAVARAAAASGAVAIVPEAGTFSYERVAETAPDAARIAQIHPFDHFDVVAERIRDAGYAALCVTVDCPTAGFRVRNRVNRFAPDLTYFAGNLVGEGTPDVAEMFGRLVSHDSPAWDWDWLAAATGRCGLPWIAKGVLTAEAAGHALAAGASALVVSNHGGRQTDPAPAALDALPEVVAEVGGRVPVLFDSGVRSGADVFVALALGADAVVIGRLAAYGLAAGGETGVRRVFELLAEELRTLMILAGVPDVASFTPDLVARCDR